MENTSEKQPKKEKEIKQPEKIVSLTEDMNGHKFDQESYDKLMREQNSNKNK